MKRLEYSQEQWREILTAAVALSRTPLWRAIQGELVFRAEEALMRIETEAGSDISLRRYQGERIAHKRDIMILEDIIKRADRALDTRNRSTNAEAED